jgi:hypothetical protein
LFIHVTVECLEVLSEGSVGRLKTTLVKRPLESDKRVKRLSIYSIYRIDFTDGSRLARCCLELERI